LVALEVTTNQLSDFDIDHMRLYIFEFKVIAGKQADGSALQQIKDKQYAQKYDVDGQHIFMIGIEFSQVTRNIVGFEWERY